jgi:acyl dehydratase
MVSPKQKETIGIIESKDEKPLVIENVSEIKKYIGKKIGTSQWLTVTQKMINDFASATLDFQWVHIDIEKAKALMPEGKTIAHGYLSMSLASQFLYQLITIKHVNSFINYGINKARFITPVKEGSRIRMHASIANAEEQGNGTVKLFLTCEMELEGAEKPAYVAELISLVM